MIDHISIAVRDLRAESFYAALLAPLGMTKLREWPNAAVGFGKKYPEFWINRREAMDRIAGDSGVHICLRAPDTARPLTHSTPPRFRPAAPPTVPPVCGRNITAVITPPSSAIPTAIASRR
jgi:hypothetical protein